MRRLLMLAAALCAAWTVEARADQVTLGRPGLDNVFIWRDSDAHSEAMKLIAANIHQTNPPLVMRLLACIAKPGDHAVITDVGLFSHTVLVVDGENSGCRGVVTIEDVNKL